LYGRDDLIARSEYIARTDMELCIHCGDCIERCVFQARVLDKNTMIFDPGKCYGCGLCVTVCPSTAIGMKKRNSDNS
jgi:MinD superfamily P-loop ATPase